MDERIICSKINLEFKNEKRKIDKIVIDKRERKAYKNTLFTYINLKNLP